MSKTELKNIIRKIPELPGVYQYFNEDGVIIYVGKAKNLHRRVSSYFNKKGLNRKTKKLVENISDIKYIVVESEQDAFLLENNLIKQYQPKYNILLKDGKSYPKICITKEEFPRVFKTRTINKNEGEYYGPFSYSNTIDYLIELIHTLYPIKTCKTKFKYDDIKEGKYKVCLKYHLKKCCGICENRCRKEVYDKYISDIKEIIKGNASKISKELESEMMSLAKELKFEEAEAVKEKYLLLEKFKNNTIINNSQEITCDAIGYDEDDKCAYISILRTNKGSIIQALVIEYEKSLEEEKEEIISHAIIELRKQLSELSEQQTSKQKRELLLPFEAKDTIETYTIPKGGVRKKILELAMENARQYKKDKSKTSWREKKNEVNQKTLQELQELLQLKNSIHIIESFDNSNIQGTDPVAACIVFKDGKPSKDDYRKYKIKTVEGANDYASMREIAYRRYKDCLQKEPDKTNKNEDKHQIPDLIIADGGIQQMHAIREATHDMLNLEIPIAGLVKDDRHRTSTLLFGFPPKEIDIRKRRELFMLLTQIQDEVHRFAITYHRKKHIKSQIKSELNEIEGLGKKSIEKIIRKYGSLKRAKSAKFNELAEIIGNKRATAFYEHFNIKINE
ncbi:MAG: excinuclease ABC subunit C [Paludibacteraceae bacterium]|nr:excinuclease ABC subunit C [Paludibacteraceae bacterium]